MSATSSLGTLSGQKIMAFAATTDAAKAKAFYGGVLGLPLLSDDGFALAFDAAGTMLRVQIVQEVAAAPYTVLGWHVSDIAATARALQAAGVRFARYPGMAQDDLGVWQSPAGSKVAWFTDPDGNTLSIAQF